MGQSFFIAGFCIINKLKKCHAQHQRCSANKLRAMGFCYSTIILSRINCTTCENLMKQLHECIFFPPYAFFNINVSYSIHIHIHIDRCQYRASFSHRLCRAHVRIVTVENGLLHYLSIFFSRVRSLYTILLYCRVVFLS